MRLFLAGDGLGMVVSQCASIGFVERHRSANLLNRAEVEQMISSSPPRYSHALRRKRIWAAAAHDQCPRKAAMPSYPHAEYSARISLGGPLGRSSATIFS